MKATKPGSPKIPTTRTTDLVCDCKRRLTVTVPAAGWRLSLVATALAERWKLPQGYETEWSDKIPALCPNCHTTTSQYPGHD